VGPRKPKDIKKQVMKWLTNLDVFLIRGRDGAKKYEFS